MFNGFRLHTTDSMPQTTVSTIASNDKQHRPADNSRHSIPKTLARAIIWLSQIKVSGKERQVLIGDDAVSCSIRHHSRPTASCCVSLNYEINITNIYCMHATCTLFGDCTLQLTESRHSTGTITAHVKHAMWRLFNVLGRDPSPI